jgi:hypothetical protein
MMIKGWKLYEGILELDNYLFARIVIDVESILHRQISFKGDVWNVCNVIVFLDLLVHSGHKPHRVPISTR